MKLITVLALIGIGAYIAIAIYSNWQTAVAIYVLMSVSNDRWRK